VPAEGDDDRLLFEAEGRRVRLRWAHLLVRHRGPLSPLLNCSRANAVPLG
jgi:hypothetical protein